MKNVLILGAGGSIASKVIQMLSENDDVYLTLDNRISKIGIYLDGNDFADVVYSQLETAK